MVYVPSTKKVRKKGGTTLSVMMERARANQKAWLICPLGASLYPLGLALSCAPCGARCRNGGLETAATPPAEASSVSGATPIVWKEVSVVLCEEESCSRVAAMGSPGESAESRKRPRMRRAEPRCAVRPKSAGFYFCRSRGRVPQFCGPRFYIEPQPLRGLGYCVIYRHKNAHEARQVGILGAELRALPLVRPPPAVSSLLARFAKRLGLPDAKN
jgi:hypothetical protein